jgi:glycine betaine/proline transport system substrate-binding protein
MKHVRKLLTFGVAMAIALTMAACGSSSGSASSSGKTITIFQGAGYDDDIAVTTLWKNLLEKKGYTVKIQSLDLAAGFTGMSRGDVDAYMDAWLPTTHAPYVDPYKDKFTILPPFFSNDRLVLAVPNFVDATTISDVAKNPSQFKNRIVGIEPGAGEMKLLQSKVMPAYGMTNMNLAAGSTPAMLAELQRDISSHTPVVVALWTPHWAFAQMPIHALTDDKKAFPDTEGSQIVVTNKYAEANPQVVSWFRNTKLTDDQLSSLMADIHGASSADAGVTKWLQTNGSVVASWTD